ncbi:CBS domain-containing protein [Enterovibrio norvegicus FF-33]|uniref:CBS domain-containing protein n=1 Tax=Enterovibrio norvegicus FF-454 TaxID=1185651 RepID=A0A1E5CCY7_9GAMM|nr:CBS domain-containing protein [Enterovibrio norvegicus]OEE63339.1 CBS domain-containing protein [Enterovibrio norvegicus FF-454]OEE69977.1 CBS domain-containing protein [Enterovibrio norvegicus FF-33]OEE76168.1 CBS domain-containing protein [Enterovibrio norvegicus FF-162]
MKVTKRVGDVMKDDFAVVDGLITVAEAIRIARDKHIKALVVDKRDENDEYGLVLMNDIAKKVLSQNRSPERVNIYEIMTKPALGVSANMNVKYCARLFERFGISRAPVIDNGEVLGVVSYNSIVMYGMLSD